jgi:hypothetical protein
MNDEQIVARFAQRNKWIRDNPIARQIGEPLRWDNADVTNAAYQYGVGGHSFWTIRAYFADVRSRL